MNEKISIERKLSGSCTAAPLDLATTEKLAEYLCSEFDFELNPCIGYSWPEHQNDDGYRGDGYYVKLQPSDVQARARENASRIIAFLSRSALPTSQSDPAPEKQSLVDQLERMANIAEDRLVEIAALRAENEQLRKALQPFALMSTEGVVKHITNYSTVTTVSDYFHTAARVLAEPRAAVAPEQEGAGE
jgi:hypothetical protein